MWLKLLYGHFNINLVKNSGWHNFGWVLFHKRTKWSFQGFTLVFKCVCPLCSCPLLWLVEWCVVVIWAKLSGGFRQQGALNGFWLSFGSHVFTLKLKIASSLRSSAHWTSPNTASPQQKCESPLSPANVVHTLKIEAEIRGEIWNFSRAFNSPYFSRRYFDTLTLWHRIFLGLLLPYSFLCNSCGDSLRFNKSLWFVTWTNTTRFVFFTNRTMLVTLVSIPLPTGLWCIWASMENVKLIINPIKPLYIWCAKF